MMADLSVGLFAVSFDAVPGSICNREREQGRWSGVPKPFSVSVTARFSCVVRSVCCVSQRHDFDARD